MREYWVYTMTNRSGTVYVGITSNLEIRVAQHKTGTYEGFTSRYRLDRLVYFAATSDAHAVIAREKQFKSWRRDRKLALIRSMNPEWNDLSASWYR